ncbi:DUF6197 family protein [Streptomyces xanthophaeus]
MQTLAPAAVQAAAPLTLEERLALAGLAMDGRLGRAGIENDVRTAHIAIAELPEILVAPQPAAPAVPTTAKEVLREAARLITAHGWRKGYVGSKTTGYCVIGAVQAAAGGDSRLEDAAEALLLDRIRAEQPDLLSAGQWNDAQSGPGPVVRMLGR